MSQSIFSRAVISSDLIRYGAFRMSIRVLALALLAGMAVAEAAPPKTEKPTTDPAATQQAPESLDVDAMARAKDEAAATPAAADTPPPAEPPAETPPAAAPVETPPPVETATPAAETPTPAEAASTKPAEAAQPSAAQAEERSIAASCMARATSLLDDAQKADFAGATRDFDAKMRTDMPPPKLKQQWDSMAQFGKLVARGQSHIGTGQGYLVVMVPLIFEKTNLVAQIACGSDGRIAGFHVTQAPKPKL
jgi:outer membrane biosynthesis protein TonB